jgi:hypothetical protein
MDLISFPAGNSRHLRIALSILPTSQPSSSRLRLPIMRFTITVPPSIWRRPVKVTALRLGDHGIHGNAHMIMLEKNNLQVAGLITEWLARTVSAR